MVTKSPIAAGRSTVSRVDPLIDHVGVVDRDLDPLIVGQFDVGPYVHLGGELELRAVGELGDIDFWLAEHPDVVVDHRLRVQTREGVIDRLLQDDGAAETLVDDPSWHLSAAKSRNVHLPGDLLVRSVEARP
jgi:hypothetical protein